MQYRILIPERFDTAGATTANAGRPKLLWAALPSRCFVPRCSAAVLTAAHQWPNQSKPQSGICRCLASAVETPTDWLQRTQLLVRDGGMEVLRNTRVLIVGLGGVGSFAAEFLCRAGVGTMTVVDGDAVDVTNKNRQLLALTSTVGLPKAQVMEQRLRDINPHLHLQVLQQFLDPEAAEQLVDPSRYDYVVDCIDSIAPKVQLLATSVRRGVPVVSSMGAGGRMDPLAIKVGDISETYNDRFAAEVRRSLRKRCGVSGGVTVVFSTEVAAKVSMQTVEGARFKKSYYGTISYIPALFGLHIAAHIINTSLRQAGQHPGVSARPPPPPGPPARPNTSKRTPVTGKVKSSKAPKSVGSQPLLQKQPAVGQPAHTPAAVSRHLPAPGMASQQPATSVGLEGIAPSTHRQATTSDGTCTPHQAATNHGSGEVPSGTQLGVAGSDGRSGVSSRQQVGVGSASGSALSQQRIPTYEQTTGVGMGYDGQGI